MEKFEKIEEIHISKAIEEIDNNGVPEGRESTGYDVYKDNDDDPPKYYPPKYLIWLAYGYANDEKLEPGSTYKKLAYKILEKYGFKFRNKYGRTDQLKIK